MWALARRWTESEETAVRLAAALDHEFGGQRTRGPAARLGRTEAAVRQRPPQHRALQVEAARPVLGVERWL